MRRRVGYVIVFFVCTFYWFLDSIWSYFSFEWNLKQLIFKEPASIVDTILLNVPPYHIVSRLTVVALFALLGLVTIEFLARRRVAEEALKTKTEFLDKLIENAAVSTWISDDQGTAIRANPACFELFGAKEDEVIGKYNLFKDVVIEKNGFQPDIQRVFEQGTTANIIIDYDFGAVDHVFVKNPEHRIINSIFTPIKDENGKVINVIVQTIDLTGVKMMERERLRLQQDLHQAQKMESIGNLAGGIAHDFNNILSSILGFTELALDEVQKDSTIHDDLQEIYTAGIRAKDLVSQILTFARQSEQETRPLHVTATIEEVLKFLRSSIPTSIEIRKNLASDSRIMGDKTQVYQVMMNLCVNATQAMETEGGVLEVNLKDTEVDRALGTKLELPHGTYIEISVSDTGAGIPSAVIDKVFEPYFTTKERGEGTGMGLALVHGIVESSGGKITVDSTVGKGTTFTIYLPATAKSNGHYKEPFKRLPSGDERILIVDDEAAIVKLTRLGLERLGYRATTRTSSVEALELFRSKPHEFDLVITDMSMPNLTGEKLAMEMIKIRPDIPIILCTGYSKNISDESAAEIGIRAFVHKPIVNKDLAITVRQVLDKNLLTEN